jgi:hypothetical protein
MQRGRYFLPGVAMNNVRLPVCNRGFLMIAVVGVLFIGGKMVTNNREEPVLGKTELFR